MRTVLKNKNKNKSSLSDTMKKMLSLVLALALMLALAACGAVATLPTDEDNINQIPNPWTDAATMEEAETAIGYGMTAPETVAGLSQSAIRVLNDSDKILEVCYGGGENDDRASLRKGTGSEDISGDYTDYAKTETVTVGDLTVTEKGGGENVFSAIWTKGDYSYAFFSTAGVSAGTLAELIAGIE